MEKGELEEEVERRRSEEKELDEELASPHHSLEVVRQKGRSL